MRSKVFFLFTLLFFTPLVSHAYWPTTIEENLSISADPDTNEMWPVALPFSDGRTFVVVDKGWIGNCYQIIDRYGELQYPVPQPLTPANAIGYNKEPHVVTDGEGGVFVAWKS